jgi:hypothetical protein
LDTGVQPCRSCGAPLARRILDLGRQPVADVLVSPADPAPDPDYPLALAFCERCFLVQLADRAPDVYAPHGHGAAFSSTARDDIAMFAGGLVASGHREGRRVVVVGQEPAGLLDAFTAEGWSTSVVEPGKTAGDDHRRSHGPADVVVAHHALAHVEDLNDAVAGMATMVAPGGVVAIEAHHVLGIVTDAQFDVTGHAHRSYFSLASLGPLLARHGLTVRTAHRVAAYGGSIRVIAGPGLAPAPTDEPDDPDGFRALREAERDAGLDRLEGYAGLEAAAIGACRGLREYLERCRDAGTTVSGYGAPARGTTLLNAAGITTDLLPYTVDRSPDKQGRSLPGCRIPIREPAAIDAARPDRILILPWPLRSEIEQQLGSARGWGARFVVALPELGIT